MGLLVLGGPNLLQSILIKSAGLEKIWDIRMGTHPGKPGANPMVLIYL